MDAGFCISEPTGEPIKALLTYSLIQRYAATKTVTMHRLVQVALKGRLPESVQHIWEEHVISAIVHLFPEEEIQVAYWQACERCCRMHWCV